MLFGDWLGISLPVGGGEQQPLLHLVGFFFFFFFKSFLHLLNCLYLEP